MSTMSGELKLIIVMSSCSIQSAIIIDDDRKNTQLMVTWFFGAFHGGSDSSRGPLCHLLLNRLPFFLVPSTCKRFLPTS